MAVTTLRGTTHIFPITTYGGQLLFSLLSYLIDIGSLFQSYSRLGRIWKEDLKVRFPLG